MTPCPCCSCCCCSLLQAPAMPQPTFTPAVPAAPAATGVPGAFTPAMPASGGSHQVEIARVQPNTSLLSSCFVPASACVRADLVPSGYRMQEIIAMWSRYGLSNARHSWPVFGVLTRHCSVALYGNLLCDDIMKHNLCCVVLSCLQMQQTVQSRPQFTPTASTTVAQPQQAASAASSGYGAPPAMGGAAAGGWCRQQSTNLWKDLDFVHNAPL